MHTENYKFAVSALALLSLVAFSGCTDTNRDQTAPTTTSATSSEHLSDNATKQLHSLFDTNWQRALRENPETATYLGDKRYNGQWSSLTLDTIAESHKADIADLDALKKIDLSALPESEKLNYRLFKNDLERAIENHQFRRFLIPLNQRGGIQTANEITEVLQFNSQKDYQDWLARLDALPTLIEQNIDIMRAGISEGITPARIVMERVPAQIKSQIVEKADDSRFFDPFRKKPDFLSEAEFKKLSDQAKNVIAEKIVPAYTALHTFFTEEYLPASNPIVGVHAQPMGREYYASRIAYFTTTQLTADEIHNIGLSEVARIRSEMLKVKDEVGFKGDLPAFFTHLRTAPQYFFKTGDELINAYRAMGKLIDPLMVDVLRYPPRTPWGIKPIPEAIAPDTTTAYYQPPAADGSRAGYYYVNLYKPETRPKWEMMALSLHEAIPGHHFQIALQQELGEVPNFRKYGGYTAFIEGWGLYAEHLGYELGLFDDPLDRFGALTYEMWRAVRLVVDTGMHDKGWTRDQAVAFFTENAPKSKLDITNEIDRYIAWPGQALAYKIGELKIKELRKKANDALGDKFNVKEFHQVVLGSGAVPLDLLESNVDAYIDRTRKQGS